MNLQRGTHPLVARCRTEWCSMWRRRGSHARPGRRTSAGRVLHLITTTSMGVGPRARLSTALVVNVVNQSNLVYWLTISALWVSPDDVVDRRSCMHADMPGASIFSFLRKCACARLKIDPPHRVKRKTKSAKANVAYLLDSSRVLS